MSFQLTFLGYYPIKSQQLKKQTHSVKRRNWSHREQSASGGRRLQTGQPSASVGRPWRTAPAAGGRPPISGSRGVVGHLRPPVDVHGVVERVRTSSGRGRGRPNA
jgi:hypothetical protein